MSPEPEPDLNPPTTSVAGDPALMQVLTDFLARARWFGGKGRDFRATDLKVVVLREGTPRVTICLVTVSYLGDDGQEVETDLYEVPFASYPEPQERLQHAFLGVVDGRHVYDAVHDRQATHVWLEEFQKAAATGTTEAGEGLTFRRSGDHELDLTTHSTLFSGEQSNSSVAFGDESLMKVFRRVTPGVNPDIEIHDALTKSGSDAVAQLYGWLEMVPPGSSDGEPLHLAMLQEFLRTASDGFDLALSSVRNLFAEADLHADEVGGDFAGESHRLGVAVSEVHQLLREHFDTVPFDTDATATAMRRRLDDATAVVPELAEHRTVLEAVFDRMGESTGEAQRVHGDLHLGQTLRTSLGWKLVDFEGEPAKPLAERRLPDSPWRDVAGMLRSFDYAAQSVVKDMHSREEPGSQVTYRATEWVQRNREAFLDGYVEARGEALTESERALVDAYEADKAVYEVVYEARNRPTWLDIPMSAIERIGAGR